MKLTTQLLIGLVTALVLAAGCYWLGDHNRDNAWVAKQSKAALQAQKKFDAEVVRGQGAVDALNADKSDLLTRYSDLERKFNDKTSRVPLIAACHADPHPKADGPAGPELVAAPTVAPADSGSGVPGPVDSDPVLSAAAVWMWNSALMGTDLSTSACGSADSTDATCAAASGITVKDAWANHEANAKSCAADRLSFQKLIDFLKGKTQ